MELFFFLGDLYKLSRDAQHTAPYPNKPKKQNSELIQHASVRGTTHYNLIGGTHGIFVQSLKDYISKSQASKCIGALPALFKSCVTLLNLDFLMYKL